jgi:hypothetical protein
VDQGLPVHQHGLGRDVDRPADPRRPAGAQHVAGALHVDRHERRPRPEVLDLGGDMEADVGALQPAHERRDVREVTAHGLGAAGADGVDGAVGARERGDGPAVAHQPLDQAPADEAGAAGDEGGCHARKTRTP